MCVWLLVNLGLSLEIWVWVWEFVVVIGLILACGHNGSGGWVVVTVVIRLFFAGLILGWGLQWWQVGEFQSVWWLVGGRVSDYGRERWVDFSLWRWWLVVGICLMGFSGLWNGWWLWLVRRSCGWVGLVVVMWGLWVCYLVLAEGSDLLGLWVAVVVFLGLLVVVVVVVVVVAGGGCEFSGFRRKTSGIVGFSCFKEERDMERKRERET